MKLNATEKNAFEALNELIRLSSIKVTSLSLKKALWQHPDFPSLNALSDILNEFKVPHLATRIPPENLAEIPMPALAYMRLDNGTFAVVRSVGRAIEWLDTQRGWQKDSFETFVQKWDGVMLLIAPEATSGEVAYEAQKRVQSIANLRLPFIVVSLLIIVGLIATPLIQVDLSWQYYALLITKLLGTVVSAMLVWYGIDSQNSFLQSVCNLTDTTNCNNVLNSPAAKLFSWLSWSEVGLFYFGGGLIYLTQTLSTGEGFAYSLSQQGKGLGIGVLSILGGLALPYTLWSVWYQWRVARQWCVLCLSIQALILVEFCIFYLTPIHSTGEGFAYSLFYSLLPRGEEVRRWGLIAGSFLLLPTLWALLKPTLQKATAYDPLFRNFQRLKFDPIYLEGLLSKPRTLPPIFEGMEVITLGNPEAENTLTIITNPMCNICKKHFRNFDELVNIYTELGVVIIVGSNLHTNDISNKVSRIILSQSKQLMYNALSDWFQIRNEDFSSWYKKYKIDYNSMEAKQQVYFHLRWIQLSNSVYTPTLFYNNVEIPEIYYKTDLKLIISRFINLGIS